MTIVACKRHASADLWSPIIKAVGSTRAEIYDLARLLSEASGEGDACGCCIGSSDEGNEGSGLELHLGLLGGNEKLSKLC